MEAPAGEGQKERMTRRRRSTRSRELETSAVIESRAESIADRPVLEHEEEVVATDLAKTSLRGPKDRTRTLAVRLDLVLETNYSSAGVMRLDRGMVDGGLVDGVWGRAYH